MIGNKSVLGLIAARGGSKRLPRKNILPLAGKPLIVWTIQAAQRSRYLDRVVLSSDDGEIIQVAEEAGCEVPFRRPEELARDSTPTLEVIFHALDQLEGFDYLVLLQPTSPLRISEDIDGAMERIAEECAPVCVSVARTNTPPQWMYTFSGSGHLESVCASLDTDPQQQSSTPVYTLNGAVYCLEVEALHSSSTLSADGALGYEMPLERSVDVDTSLDLLWCEFLLRRSGDAG